MVLHTHTHTQMCVPKYTHTSVYIGTHTNTSVVGKAHGVVTLPEEITEVLLPTINILRMDPDLSSMIE